MLPTPHADPCQYSVKIYTHCIMGDCGCNRGGARRTRRRVKHRRARSERRPKMSRRHIRSLKNRRGRRRRQSRRGGGANRLMPQGLVNTFRNVSNAVQTKFADITGGRVPISPSVLVQTPMKRPDMPTHLNAISPIKVQPNSPIKKASPFRGKK